MAIPKKTGHEPVLVAELVAGLGVRPGGRYVDCTLGGGGHAAAVLEASSPGGRLLGIDADEDALGLAGEWLRPYGRALTLAQGNFRDLRGLCSDHGLLDADGVYFDLGLSSMQLEAADRGFSFQKEGPLDMRFSKAGTVSGSDVVNDYAVDELADVLRRYGQERKSRLIARRIASRRPIETTTDLARIVAGAYPPGRHRIHPATRTFQALRICVNDELTGIAQALEDTVDVLKPEGRVAVISYHSLEDRIVKNFFRDRSADFAHVPGAPGGGHPLTPSLAVVTRRAVVPTAAETARNPRSRSAKLRVARKLGARGDRCG